MALLCSARQIYVWGEFIITLILTFIKYSLLARSPSCATVLQEGLLERQEFLQWILELLDRLRSAPSDDGILRLLMPLALQYLNEFTKSELLARKLAYLCGRKLAQLCASTSGTSALANSGCGSLNSLGTQSAILNGTANSSSELQSASPLLNSVSPHSPMVNGSNTLSTSSR